MREYARQRGVHLNAVQTAVKTGRIHKTADGKIDVDAANKEWFMNTDPAKSHKRVLPSETWRGKEGRTNRSF